MPAAAAAAVCSFMVCWPVVVAWESPWAEGKVGQCLTCDREHTAVTREHEQAGT